MIWETSHLNGGGHTTLGDLRLVTRLRITRRQVLALHDAYHTDPTAQARGLK